MLMTGVVNTGGGRRGPRRTGSQQDDSDTYNAGRPSAPATLFDFVTSKMPQSSSSGILSDYNFSVNQATGYASIFGACPKPG